MPIYEYRCEKGHTFEVMQRMSEDSLTNCITCSAPVQRVFHPVAVHFKGSGFYNTDYGKQKKSGSKEAKSESSSSGDSGSNSGSDKSSSSDSSKKSDSSSSKASTSSSKE